MVVLLGPGGLSELPAAIFTVTNTADNGPGSLRVAISNANSIAGTDLINFSISGSGPFTINLGTVLPSILEPVTIDGTTQTGYSGKPLIELNGAAAAGNGTGIYLLTSNSVIKGLSVSRFSRDGIRTETFGGNLIQANFVGTGPFGTNSLGNGNGASGVGGLTILSPGNLIGGLNTAERNVISGGNRHGIFLLTSAAISNTIQGNFIGTDFTGTKRLGNVNNGIALAAGALNNFIGGTNAGARNLISGNGQSGIYLLDNTTIGNSIQGNFIGTDAAGATALSNASDGITLFGAIGNLVGGTNAAARNVISGNNGRGIIVREGGASNLIQGNYIGTDAAGMAKLGNRQEGVEIFNASGNIIGGGEPGARNLISGNGLSGVSLTDSNSTGNAVLGNFVGTDASGSNALGNSRSGVFISGVASNTIGGTATGARNVISGNAENGILITDPRARGNVLQGNLVGTDLNGTRRIANGAAGVRLESPANFLGGPAPGTRNVISGNSGSGVYFYLAPASNNIVQGNFIGTTATGDAALANDFAGIGLTNASNNLIGGTNPGSGNLVSGNNLNGIYLQGRADGNAFQGNRIGTDNTGMAPVPNGAGLPLGDYGGAIDISGAAANLIGGTNVGAGNLISANWRDAIAIGDAGATNNVIQGNLIGVKADGFTALGNDRHGIEIRAIGGGGQTRIGGTESGAGNIIAYAAFPQYSGVRIRPQASNTGVLVRGNSIYFNGGSGATGLGIDLGAFDVNPNDNCDADTGANLQQNFPVLTNAQSAGSVTVVRGTLNSAANTTFLLQFYANPVAEPSGRVEGKIFLGDGFVTTDGGCNGAFTALLTNGVPAGARITATATDPANNTSEFSTNIMVTAAQLPTFGTQPQSQTVSFGSNVTFTAGASGTGSLTYQWHFNGTNVAGATTTALDLTNVQLSNAGNYSVTASNTFGTTTSTNAVLTVLVTAPTLTATPGGDGTLTVSWPTGGPAFRLQECTNLAPPISWGDVTNSQVISNSQFLVTLTPTGQNRFFRLALP